MVQKELLVLTLSFHFLFALRVWQSAMVSGCELCKKLFDENMPGLVAQALDAKFVQYLLDLLKDGLDRVENSSACKAHIVTALKAMAKDLARGDEVNGILDRCSWWSQYKGERGLREDVEDA